MASSSSGRTYPPRLYAEGKAPKAPKSMNHNVCMANLKMFKAGLGVDAWKAVRNSSVGVFAKFQELTFTWSAATVHHLLTHQLVVGRPYELWSLVDDQPIRFSLHELEAITGLNCAPFKENDTFVVDHEDFWREIGTKTYEGPSLDELALVLDICGDWDLEKRIMIGWLAILSVGILGIASNGRIPLELAKRVLDPQVFETYPWGRVACKSLVDCVKTLKYEGSLTYTLRGCAPALLIWAYESIPVFGELFGNRRNGEVPLLSYAASRPRDIFVQVLKEDKQTHDNKVRVKHFLHRMDQSLEPVWVDDCTDGLVTNMVEDILQNRLDSSGWSVGVVTIINRRRENVQCTTKTKPKRRKAGTTPVLAAGTPTPSDESNEMEQTNIG